MKNRFIAIIVLLSMIICLASCSAPKQSNNGKLKIVATLYPQYDFAKQICGDKADVYLLMLPGADAHSFELTAADALNINNSDLFIYIGPQMEIWADSIIKSAPKSMAILNLSEHTELVFDHQGKADAHIWTSPVVARDMLKAIFEAVSNGDKENFDFYENNYKKYDEELIKLDESFKALASESNNKTAYFCGAFAFEYLFHEYGFNHVAPFNSCSGVEIESLGSISKLVAQINKNNVKYVFSEANKEDPMELTITSQTKASILRLHSIHEISESEYKNDIGYLTLMNENLKNLRKVFCDGKTS